MHTLTRTITLLTTATLLAAATGACAATTDQVFTTAQPQGVPAKADDIVPRMTVRGNAELEKPADQVEIRISVITDGDDAEDAIRSNARDSEDVLDALSKLKLTEDEYETGQYRVSPQYSRRPRNASIDWKPEIIGYRVTNTVIVTTKRINDAGKIIQEVT